jgi:moderate conductance mechanosensitive channel
MEISHQMGARIADRLREVLHNIPNVPEQVKEALLAASPDGGIWWFLPIVGETLIVIFVAFLFSVWIGRKTRDHYVAKDRPVPKLRHEKIFSLIGWSLIVALVLLLCTAMSMAASFMLNDGGQAMLDTRLILIETIAVFFGIRVFFYFFLATGHPERRVFQLDDNAVKTLNHYLVGIFSLGALVGGVCLWFEKIGLQQDAHILMLMVGSALVVLFLSMILVRNRKVFAQMILGHGPQAAFFKVIAGNWHILAILYLIGAWFFSNARLLNDLSLAGGLILMPITSIFLAVVFYGFLLACLDAIVLKRRAHKMLQMGDHEEQAHDQALNGLHHLWEKTLAIFVLLGEIWCLLWIWGVDVTSETSVVVAVLDVVFVAFAGYVAFQVIRISIDQKIAEEGGFEAGEPGDEGGGTSASRLATLLPLFRNFLLIAAAVLSVMIILSQMGVDIGPLFAGAGVVGIAIGFGAQTLIGDILSGAFFLVDDAFRVGEYISLGTVKGTVERISIRSMQLRHHLGPLHTVPFGQVQTLTNYSRDWAMMKLTLRVTYDTDVDKVRKLVKKLGQQLLEDPEIGDKFLQPLKSQGVLSMEDSAMILRVKFMTKPGEQFVIRKRVYAELRALFAENGIQFAHKEVLVRVADKDGQPVENLTPEEKEQIAGGVLPLLDEDGKAGAAPDKR